MPSLAELQAGDPQSRGDRFLCPSEECKDKRQGHHRSLRLDRETGKFLCHRCKFAGMLDDFKPRQRRYQPTVSGIFGDKPSQRSRRSDLPKWLKDMHRTLPENMMRRQIERLREVADEMRLGIDPPGRDHADEVLSAAVLIEDLWTNDR